MATGDIGFAQMLIRCKCCPNKAELFCRSCDVNMCRNCVASHTLSLPQEHVVIKYSAKFDVYPKPCCPKHLEQKCNLHCQVCDIPVCTECIASGEHVRHEMQKVSENQKAKEGVVVEEIKFLEEKLVPEYQRIIELIKEDIDELPTRSSNLKSEMLEQGKELHNAVERVINKRLSEIDAMENKNLDELQKTLSEFENRLAAILELIRKNKEILQFRQTDIANSQSHLNKLSQLPPRRKFSPGRFEAEPVNDEKISSLFGKLHPSSLKAVIEDKAVSRITRELSFLQCYQRELLDCPEIIATTDIKIKEPCLVSCLGNNEAWISGCRGNMTRVDSEGSVLETVITKSGRYPHGLAITSDGDLLYTDFANKTICRVRNGKVDVLIHTEGHPSGICVTSSGDILVALYETEVNIARYTGTSKIQDIPYGETKRALIENNDIWLQIAENRNGDICVSDLNSKAVVILSQEGKAKSRYVKATNPHCITTDSVGHILVSDNHQNCVYILDSHGAGLSIINNCLLNVPVGVSVDSDDRLWVVERDSGKLNIIKYMK
ncbi:uncharacterized protein LOC134269358 [Saccostrea cucullata]|uniref:uncharacterized protein LOC134269358 n=1 Tax=Saccostrea cuccullata TaxID=36930 RepID=UPI002ED50D61